APPPPPAGAGHRLACLRSSMLTSAASTPAIPSPPQRAWSLTRPFAVSGGSHGGPGPLWVGGRPRIGTGVGLVSGLLLGDVDHPGNAESVHAHAELVTPHLLLQRDRYGAAVRQLLPVAPQLITVVPAEAHGDVVPGVALHPGRGVRSHEREPAGGLELAVHDLVGDG